MIRIPGPLEDKIELPGDLVNVQFSIGGNPLRYIVALLVEQVGCINAAITGADGVIFTVAMTGFLVNDIQPELIASA